MCDKINLRYVKYENDVYIDNPNLILWIDKKEEVLGEAFKNIETNDFMLINDYESYNHKCNMVYEYLLNNQTRNFDDLTIIYMPKTNIDYIFLTHMLDGIIIHDEKTFLVNTPKIIVISNSLPNYNKISKWKVIFKQ